MSKLIDNIKTDLTGIRYPKRIATNRLIVGSTECIDRHKLEFLPEYKIEAGLKIKVRCSPDDLISMIDNAIKQIRLELYGDIQESIIRLERAIYEEREEDIRIELSNIKNEIFG